MTRATSRPTPASDGTQGAHPPATGPTTAPDRPTDPATAQSPDSDAGHPENPNHRVPTPRTAPADDPPSRATATNPVPTPNPNPGAPTPRTAPADDPAPTNAPRTGPAPRATAPAGGSAQDTAHSTAPAPTPGSTHSTDPDDRVPTPRTAPADDPVGEVEAHIVAAPAAPHPTATPGSPVTAERRMHGTAPTAQGSPGTSSPAAAAGRPAGPRPSAPGTAPAAPRGGSGTAPAPATGRNRRGSTGPAPSHGPDGRPSPGTDDPAAESPASTASPSRPGAPLGVTRHTSAPGRHPADPAAADPPAGPRPAGRPGQGTDQPAPRGARRLRRLRQRLGSFSFSIKTKLGTLVVVSVFITTGLLLVALRTETELRFITVFSVIATLLLTQFFAHGLTAPLDEMNTVAKGISHGDYTRRVRGAGRRDELGDLACTINRMADDLEAVDRHRKELVANVSHELRTPIAALRAVLENVVDGVSAADPETMRTALAQTERLGRLVETLLDLSRLDNGVVPLKARCFEVWPYLSGVLKEAGLAASQRKAASGCASGPSTRSDVHLHLDVSPPELTAYADVERLHQVVANLIDNAVKHSPPHGRVTVRARRGPTPESLDLEVLDEGPGIPEPERHTVFERFNRGSVPSPHGPGSDGGTGLGLAIARWAVDLHGGRIGVAESARGCRILVTLPGIPPQRG